MSTRISFELTREDVTLGKIESDLRDLGLDFLSGGPYEDRYGVILEDGYEPPTDILDRLQGLDYVKDPDIDQTEASSLRDLATRHAERTGSKD